MSNGKLRKVSDDCEQAKVDPALAIEVSDLCDASIGLSLLLRTQATVVAGSHEEVHDVVASM